jgi:hypothetical protein
MVYHVRDELARPSVDAGRLWAGGLATALVAVLLTIAGILVARGVFGASILAPKGAGVWGDASTAWYAFGAAVASLAATALMHLLILFTPRPTLFFGWVVGSATALAVLAPFVTSADLASRVFTAGLNLVLGVAIGTLVTGTARGAVLPPQSDQEGLQPR